jgi:hypothetical protein
MGKTQKSTSANHHIFFFVLAGADCNLLCECGAIGDKSRINCAVEGTVVEVEVKRGSCSASHSSEWLSYRMKALLTHELIPEIVN